MKRDLLGRFISDNKCDSIAVSIAHGTYVVGEHAHQCDKCGKIWRHSDRAFNSRILHICDCGHEQFDSGLSPNFNPNFLCIHLWRVVRQRNCMARDN
jgi:hypothetical protein